MSKRVFDVEAERANLRVKRCKKERKAADKELRVVNALYSRISEQFGRLTHVYAASDTALDGNFESEYGTLSGNLLKLERSIGNVRQRLTDVFITQQRLRAESTFNLGDIRQSEGRLGDASVIIIDPPWDSDNPGYQIGTGDQYDTMSDEALCALPVGGVAAEDCSLLLWTTFPKLESAFRVLKAWGFKYQTVFTVWIKIEKFLSRLRMTSGVVTRPNAEIVLIGTRGNMRTKLRKNFRRCNVLLSRPQQHSQKPEMLKQIAVELYGDKPRMEIFSRTRTLDWRCWGNEVAQFDPTATTTTTTTTTTDVIGETKVSSAPESKRHASQKKQRRNNLRAGAFVNAKNKRLQSGPKRGNGGALKASAKTLGYYTPHNCVSKNQFVFYSDGAGTEHTEEVRETLVQSVAAVLDEQGDDNQEDDQANSKLSASPLSDLPLRYVVSQADLARTRSIAEFCTSDDASTSAMSHRHPLYVTMSNHEVADNIDAIYTEQKLNSDKLFVFNYNTRSADETRYANE